MRIPKAVERRISGAPTDRRCHQDPRARSVQELFLDHLEEEARRQGVVFHALAKICTLASVEGLLRLKGDSDTDYFRNVCVEAIQKRLGTGDQGWLSLAAPAADQGALNTADEGSTLAIAKSEED
jgi:hypothetical protein